MTRQSGPFIRREIVQELNEKHGWFQYADARSDVSNAFANEAIERYERIRSAAPDLLHACEQAREWLESWASAEPYISVLDAAIAKAKGEPK